MAQPIIYPAPFVVRNTFIDFNEARPPSLDEFVQVRQVRSCPTSAVEQPEGEQASPAAWPYHPAGGLPAPFACYAVAPVAEGGAAPCCAAGVAAPAQGSSSALAPQVMAAHSQVPVQRCWLPSGVQSAHPAEGSFQPPRAAPVQPPPAGQEELPSAGSAGHYLGQCRPCAFVNSRGCVSGKDCQFCHLCEPGEKKRRQKEKKAFFNTMRQLQQSVRDGWPSRWA